VFDKGTAEREGGMGTEQNNTSPIKIRKYEQCTLHTTYQLTTTNGTKCESVCTFQDLDNEASFFRTLKNTNYNF
jgi:hypothetical protein